MAPDFLEPDRPVSDTDIADSLEATCESPPSVPGRARRSLFQIVCLEGSGQDPQPITASL
jgi:hypothetical protein